MLKVREMLRGVMKRIMKRRGDTIIATESQYVEQIDYYSKEWEQMQPQCIEENHA
jgi:hypothetical protein